MAQRDFDVVVVGGGLAGLAAARRLCSAQSDIALLEASDRIGGRTRSGTIDREPVDFGAEWTGRGHWRLVRLVNELGLHLDPAGLVGRPALWRGTERTRLGRIPRLSAREEIAFVRMLWRAKRLARRLDPQRPWRTSGAESLDAVSLSEWLYRMGVGGDAHRYFALFVGALISAPIDSMSLLHFLWWVRRGGGPFAMMSTTFGYHVREGAEAISRGMSDSLGRRIIVNARAQHVEQSIDGVEVTTSAGERYTAARAVLAVPCRALAEIEFTPHLPPLLGELAEIRNEPGTKVHALLPADHDVRARFAFGGSSLAGAWRRGRRITGFAIPPADELPEQDLLKELAGAFRVPPGDLQATAVYRWRDHPSIPGCDIAFAPGELTRLGDALKESHGRIHFAGAERGSWPNNMEGALESGSDCAEAVLATSATG